MSKNTLNPRRHLSKSILASCLLSIFTLTGHAQQDTTLYIKHVSFPP